MKTLVEAKIFKNGGSSAIRLPASLNLTGGTVFLEVDDESDDVIIKRRKPNPFDELFARQEKYGPITDDEWVLKRDNDPEPTRASIQELIDAK